MRIRIIAAFTDRPFQFPSEQAAVKVLYLAVRNLEVFRRPNVGIRSSGWKQALQAFTIYFDRRIPTPPTIRPGRHKAWCPAALLRGTRLG